MKQNNPAAGPDYGKLVGVIFLTLIWVWLSVMLFTRGGVNLKNILIEAFSGIIIFVPLWKRYIQPLLNARKKN